jgi:hypothetical protein
MLIRWISIAAVMVLASAGQARGVQLIIPSCLGCSNVVYTVDATTNTSPQVWDGIIVGSGAEGTLNILDGRWVRSMGTVHVGFTASSLPSGIGYVNVLGNRSTLVAPNHEMNLGVNIGNQQSGTGTLYVESGARVRVLGLELGSGSNTAGAATVTGTGARLETMERLAMRSFSAATVTIGPGATVSVGTSIEVTTSVAQIRLEGGRLSVPGPGTLPSSPVLQFGSGSFRFRSSQTLDGAPGFYTNFFGSPPVLGAANPGLILDGATTLSTSLRLDGGSLRTGRIAVDPAAGSVLLAGGSLTLTGEGAVLDDGSDFGPDPLTVGDGAGDPARLVLRSPETMLFGDVAVRTDGALSFSGEALVLDSLDNDGSVTIVGATLLAPGGLINNGSLRLVDVVIDGDVISPAGSTIDVAGTVVFNGTLSGDPAIRGSGTVIFGSPASASGG